MTAVATAPVKPLARFFPVATALAVAAHVLVVLFFLLQTPPGGGGGGKVLGQLSVSLGGLGALGPAAPESAEPVVETPVVPPSQSVAPPSPPAEQASVAKPRVAQTEPVRPLPVVTPKHVREPVEPTPVVRRAPGDHGDGNPIGARSSGALTLGEGVPSQTAGLGASDIASGDQMDAYLTLIRARIEKNRTYPSAARRRSEEGTATIRVVIDAEGRLTQADVTGRSGSFHLDRAAKRMVEKSAPFPPPPTAPFTTTIPILFALR